MLLDYWVLTEHEYMGPSLTHAEGMILGTGAKMFTIAGPVIVYGVSASVLFVGRHLSCSVKGTSPWGMHKNLTGKEKYDIIRKTINRKGTS